MQAYILNSERRIAPFEEPPGALRIHNRSLRETQLELLAAVGCRAEVIDDLRAIRIKPCLLVHDDLYFTGRALRGFLKAVRRRRRQHDQQKTAGSALRNFRAALACSMLTEQFSPTFQGRRATGADGQELRAYDLYYLEDHDDARAVEDQAEILPIPYRLMVQRWRANRHFEPSGSIYLPMSLVALCPIQHWAALITANLLGLPSRIAQTAISRPWSTLSLPLRTALRAGSLRPAYLSGKFYWAGRGCKVHPSAHVEWALLGNNVRIGPGAVVRASVIADRVEIGPNAIVDCCSIGEKTTINGNVTLRSCIVGEEANVGAYFTQLSVIGRGAALCPSSGTYDFNLRGNVPVAFQGRSVSSGSRMLGSCLGHGAFLGAEVTLASGQELPNGCILVRNPREVVGDVSRNLPPGVLRLDRGRRRSRGGNDAIA